MLNIRQLQEEETTIESLKMITEALGDVATSRLKATRASMQQNIQFFQEVFQVYRTIKLIALKNQKLQKSKSYKALQKQKNGKTVCVLLTSNQRFNGGLDTDITNYFLSQTAKAQEADFIIVGSLGQEFLASTSFPHPWTGIKFKKDFPTLEELKSLSEKVFAYSRVLVYHTQFVTILNQTPTATDVTSSDIQVKPEETPVYYIVEPEIDKMMEFFEGQIMVLLFQAIFLEVDLARLAARMISMNQAGDSATKILVDEKKQLLRAKKQSLNLKILETYAGMLKRL